MLRAKAAAPTSPLEFVESITDRLVFFANFPYAGRSRDEDFGRGFRSFAVAILRIVHGRRDLGGLFARENDLI
jgi:hypothetical protein